PVTGQKYIELSYSPCLKFVVQKMRRVEGKDVVLAHKEINTISLRLHMGDLYCGKERQDFHAHVSDKDSRIHYSRVLNTCMDKYKVNINAATGYLIHLALENDNTMPPLLKFKEVRQIRPLLLDKDFLFKHPFAMIESEISRQHG